MNEKNLLWTLVFLILVAQALAITGTTGGVTADGHITVISFNVTGPYESRGLLDYITGQFKDSWTHIILRGRFSQLQAENTAPATPPVETQTNDTYSNVTSTMFSWTNATDADNDTISYIFEAYNDSSLTLEFTVNNSIIETATPTEVTANLHTDQIYYWRVAANDSSKNSTFTDLRIYTIDTTLPTAFNITSPTDSSSTTDNTPTLEWDTSTDTNSDNYSIEISTTADFSTISRTENSSTNTFSSWNSSLAAGTYYWRVNAIDKANNQRLSENNRSFTITALVETVQQGGGTTPTAGGISPKPYSFHIIAPPSITIFQGDSIIIPLEIQNLGREININDITLSVEGDSRLITPSLDKTSIATLKPSSSVITNLIIQAAENVGTFSVTITADASLPRLHDAVKIITNIIGKEGPDKNAAQQQLVFAKKLFDGNPQCNELLETLEQAERELEQDNTAEALELTSEAINKCKELVAVKVSEKPGLLGITINAIRENKTVSIISSEVIAT
ncbi:MAG: hypothetical protein AABX49_00705, partial [Nanoarchaeota archaeon]